MDALLPVRLLCRPVCHFQRSRARRGNHSIPRPPAREPHRILPVPRADLHRRLPRLDACLRHARARGSRRGANAGVLRRGDAPPDDELWGSQGHVHAGGGEAGSGAVQAASGCVPRRARDGVDLRAHVRACAYTRTLRYSQRCRDAGPKRDIHFSYNRADCVVDPGWDVQGY